MVCQKLSHRLAAILCAVFPTVWGAASAQSSPSTGRSDFQFLPADGGAGEEPGDSPQAVCVTPAQRIEIEQQIAANRQMLVRKSLLAPDPQLLVRFRWPLRAVGTAGEAFGTHRLANFVDDNSSVPGAIQDYECAARSYNGHRGTDIALWPFGWLWFDADEIHVVAAAKGMIVHKSGGHFDENCGPSALPWNAIYVEHGDGSTTWYGHLKKGSLTTKSVGEHVAQGEYLGVVGSSGNSSNLHLHFEVYDGQGRLVDPYAGPCNTRNLESWWVSQRPYYDSAINLLLISSAPVVFPPCPGRPITNELTVVPRGSPAFFSAFYRDQLNSQVSEYRILRPSGTLFQTWSHSIQTNHYVWSWWYWPWTIPSTDPTGTWKFEVVYEGVTYSKEFEVN